MLVLRRKAGEAIILNGSITIHVLAVEGERVKLGISAPPEVVIVRSELLDGPGMSQPNASHNGAHNGSHHREPHPYREGEPRPYRESEPQPYREPEPTRATMPAPAEDLPPTSGVYTGPGRYAARRRAFQQDGTAPMTNSPLRYR